MSGFIPAPGNSDGRVFASYPLPAKIDLIRGQPRRESVVERELDDQIGSTLPKLEQQANTSEQQTITTSTTTTYHNQARPLSQKLEQNCQANQYEQHILTNVAPLQSNSIHLQKMVQQVQEQQQQQFPAHQVHQEMPAPVSGPNQTGSLINNAAFNERMKNNAALLANDLAEKEAKLMADITSLQKRPYSPFQTPDKIDLTNEQRSLRQQCQLVPPSRTQSAASNKRSTSVAADLLDKEAKLLQEIEEMERKPYNPQTMIVEREQWFEYPEGRSQEKQLTDSRRRVKDFCSLPSYMYDGLGGHVYEENLQTKSASPSSRPPSSAGSIHTTIIRSPKREIDNRSPLPIAFDNFSTKGVRGNIASIGAIEPERPRPPIYPIIRRTPSPSVAR